MGIIWTTAQKDELKKPFDCIDLMGGEEGKRRHLVLHRDQNYIEKRCKNRLG